MKVGNNPKNSFSEDDTNTPGLESGSWRQAIFKRVNNTPLRNDKPIRGTEKRTKEDLRILWKKSIYQAMLLVRMEKENAAIRGTLTKMNCLINLKELFLSNLFVYSQTTDDSFFFVKSFSPPKNIL